jgi:hypothetical protein
MVRSVILPYRELAYIWEATVRTLGITILGMLVRACWMQ